MARYLGADALLDETGAKVSEDELAGPGAVFDTVSDAAGTIGDCKARADCTTTKRRSRTVRIS